MAESWFPTVASVRTLITTSLSDAQIQEIMEDAYAMTAACIDDLPEATKTAIVKYTTAHIIYGLPAPAASGGGSVSGVVTSESLGDASVTYASNSSTVSGLGSSTFGQMALALDPNGCLEQIGKGKATVDVLRSSSRNRCTW